jgi:queuosine precursor transporter
MRYLNTALYIGAIVAVNWAFTRVEPIPLPIGGVWQPVALMVGFVFVLRDFAQREIGHWVLAAMAVGVVLSYFMAEPFIAVASATAFLLSEVADWAVYSFTGKPLSQRVLWSSVISTPIDSAVFLGMIGVLSLGTFLAMTISKLIGALIVWALIRRRETAVVLP